MAATAMMDESGEQLQNNYRCADGHGIMVSTLRGE